MSARWRCWTDMRMLDWDTVPLLDGTLLNERKLAVLDGRESATLDWGHRDLYVPHVTPKVTQSYPKKQKLPGYR